MLALYVSYLVFLHLSGQNELMHLLVVMFISIIVISQ